MIKVPGTKEGIPAIRQLVSEGLNINITLLFSQEVYQQVAEAYVAGLGEFAARGGDVSKIASVASFFISRIDSLVDSMLADRLKTSKDPKEQEQLKGLEGKVAIANGKLAYQRYLKIFSTDGWKKLAAKGGQTQRVLWASTSTKNPKFSDVMYVEELIGQDTVNTIPPATLDAYRDHGHPRASLTEDLPAAERTMKALAQLGISIDEVTDKLTDDGVRLFSEAFDKLLAAVEKSAK
jgi:transaldolase/glucose-6-phosphate isomerase